MAPKWRLDISTYNKKIIQLITWMSMCIICTMHFYSQNAPFTMQMRAWCNNNKKCMSWSSTNVTVGGTKWKLRTRDVLAFQAIEHKNIHKMQQGCYCCHIYTWPPALHPANILCMLGWAANLQGIVVIKELLNRWHMDFLLVEITSIVLSMFGTNTYSSSQPQIALHKNQPI